MASETKQRQTMPLSRGPAIGSGSVDCYRLKQYRRQRGWTQATLAANSGVAVQAIRRLEQRSGPANTTTVCSLAKALAIPVGALLGEPAFQIDSFSLPANARQPLREFVRHLASSPEPAKILGQLSKSLPAISETPRRPSATIQQEEQVLGTWSSLMAAYGEPDWTMMRKRARRLIELGEQLGRPTLVAIGRIYSAKATRNMPGRSPEQAAWDELMSLPRPFESSLACRLAGKIYMRTHPDSRTKLSENDHSTAGSSPPKALRCYKAALDKLEEFPNCERDDFLYWQEKTKLHRNIARAYMQIACGPEEEHSPGKLSRKQESKLREAQAHLTQAWKALSQLKKHANYDHEVEEVLLLAVSARLLRLFGKYRQAIARSVQAQTLAVARGADYVYIKMAILQLRCHCEMDDYAKASRLYSELRELRPNFTPSLERAFHKIKQKWESEIKKHAEAEPVQGPEVFRLRRRHSSELAEELLNATVEKTLRGWDDPE
ncbi:MAG: helix-turn-helix domain-containing protein [Phycisphaerae bacterium]